MTTAAFTKIDAGNLFERNGAVFYRVTPVKGARVDGVVSVGMSSHEIDAPNSRHYDPKISAPAMWIDYTPMHADNRGDRELMTVNGREYGAGFGGSVSGRVELFPAASYPHLERYCPATFVDGRKYYLRASIAMFDSVTDKARELLNAVAAAIAAEYVTDAAWLAFRISQAEYRVKRATEARDEAQAKLDAAAAELVELLK